MRIFGIITFILAAGVGIVLINRNYPQAKEQLLEVIESGNFHTLEVKFSANSIMENHQRELLKDSKHKYVDPVLKFYPYLLIEVKYTLPNDKTREGLILWDLTDGEMVMDTKDWEKTHGFSDCINSNAQPSEFKILNILARGGGSSDRETLSKGLQVDNEILDSWIDSCRRKKLIVQSGNKYRLHLQSPRFKNIPETKINEKLVTKSYKNALRMPKRYSISQIEKLAHAAFGNDFAIRKMRDVYLPVHSIIVQNPDGTIQTTLWNALNGKNLSHNYFLN